MGPGFKYHVATIASIFFALAVGLVVGSLYVSPRLADRQTRAIESLRKTFNKTIADQQTQLTAYRQFAAHVTPALLRDKLAGVDVAIVQTGDYPEATARTREALEAAGARVLSATVIERAFGQPDVLLNQKLAELHAADSRFPTDRDGLARLFAALLANGESPNDTFLEAMDRAQLIDQDENGDYKTPARYVVIVAGSRNESENRPANVDQPLILALQKQNVTVVACEPQDALVSDIPNYHTLNLDLPTVDNVDTDIGQCALVFALRGDKDDYGVKTTANQLLPPGLSK